MSIKKTAIIITIISLICKLFGFGREIVLAYFFGTSYVVDAYLMASAIPGILFGWIASIAISYTPIYTDIRENMGQDKSKEFTNNIISLIMVVSVVCVLFGIVFSKQIVRLTAPGFTGDVFNLTANYFYVSIWTILFIAPIQILTAYLNCHNKFTLSNSATLVISSVQLVFIIIAGFFGIELLIYGVVVANTLHFIIVFIIAWKHGLKIIFNISFTPEVKKAFIIVIPIFISSMIDQLNKFIDKSFASGLVEGSIAALNYANILQGFIFTIFTIAITTMIYPMLSQAVAEKNITKVKDIFSKGTNIIIILFVPITIGSIILAQPTISFVFKRGEFGSASTMMTVSAFIMYSIGLLAVALRDVITKVFYSMQDTKPTLYIGAFAVILNILFNLIFIKPMGHSGLALATSLSAIISIPLFFIVLRKKLGALGLKNTTNLFIKSCISTAVMGVVVYFGYNWLSGVLGGGKLSILLSLVLSAGVGGIIYFALMIVLKVKEMNFFTDIIKNVASKLIIRI